MHRPATERTFRLFATLTAIIITAVGCASGGNGSDADAGPATHVVPNPYPQPVATECSARAPNAHAKAQRSAFNHRLAGEEFGPQLPTDQQCRPLLDRSCSSVCDCSFAVVGCRALGVSIHQPWAGWGVPEKVPKNGACVQKNSGCMPSGLSSDVSLACTNSICVASGSRSSGADLTSPDTVPASDPVDGAKDLVCDAAAPDAWSAELYRRLLAGRSNGSGSAEAYDASCQPVVKRDCSSVCDCKFVLTNCGVDAASIAETGNYWPPKETSAGSSKCSFGASCPRRTHAPGACQPRLGCTKGKCVATDSPASSPCVITPTPGG